MSQVFDTSGGRIRDDGDKSAILDFDTFITRPIPLGHIIVAACQDECVSSLSLQGKQWFAKMGSNEIFNVEDR